MELGRLCNSAAAQHEGHCLSALFKIKATKYTWKCKSGHEWQATATSVLTLNTWCPTCHQMNRTKAQRAMYSRDQAIQHFLDFFAGQGMKKIKNSMTDIVMPIAGLQYIHLKIIKAELSGVVRLAAQARRDHLNIIVPAHKDNHMIIIPPGSDMSIMLSPRYESLKHRYSEIDYDQFLEYVKDDQHTIPVKQEWDIEYLRKTTKNESFIGESCTHMALTKIYGKQYHRTPEGCQADSYLSIEDHLTVLPVQLKTTMSQNLRLRWSMKHDYDQMLCIFHSPRHELFAVIPGHLINDQQIVNIEMDGNNIPKKSCRYSRYVVGLQDLPSLLHQIHVARCQGDCQLDWPCCKDVDISRIRLMDSIMICVPQHNNGRIEHQNHLYRQGKLKGVEFVRPEMDASPYDWLVFGKRIQDKTSSKEKRGLGWHISFTHSDRARNTPEKHTVRHIYQRSDFDYLWAHVDREVCYVIPSDVLQARGYFHDESQSGKWNLRLYPYGSQSKQTDWQNEFLFKFSDPEMQQKLECMLVKKYDKTTDQIIV